MLNGRRQLAAALHAQCDQGCENGTNSSAECVARSVSDDGIWADLRTRTMALRRERQQSHQADGIQESTVPAGCDGCIEPSGTQRAEFEHHWYERYQLRSDHRQEHAA